MFKVQRAFLMVVAVVGMGAVLFGTAGAATSVLGPTVCVPTGPSGSAGFEYFGFGVRNETGAQHDILCTLFRDNTTNTNGMQDLEVAVKIDPGFPGTITCDAATYDRNGNPVKVVRRTTSTANANGVVLDWGSSLNLSVSKGHYVVRCTLPDQALIRSIFYLEP
jgi:hypothetical protein